MVQMLHLLLTCAVAVDAVVCRSCLVYRTCAVAADAVVQMLHVLLKCAVAVDDVCSDAACVVDVCCCCRCCVCRCCVVDVCCNLGVKLPEVNDTAESIYAVSLTLQSFFCDTVESQLFFVRASSSF